MYKKQKQTGNTALIIIIVVVIVLALVALGLILFQRTNNGQDTDTTVATVVDDTSDSTVEDTTTEATTTTTTPTTTTTTTTTTTSNTKTGKENFEITQWGVTGYYQGSYSAEYLITGGTLASFTSSDLTGDCANGIVGSMNKLRADDTYPAFGSTQTVEEAYLSGNETQKSNIKYIGSYYYVYVSPQQACSQHDSSSPDPIYVDTVKAIRDYFNTLVAV